MEREILFIELRNELPTKAGEGDERGKENRRSRADSHPWPGQRLVEQGLIAAPGCRQHTRLLLLDLTSHEQRHHRWYEGQRQDKRCRKRQHHRDRHRREHLAFHPVEREQRQIHQDNDGLTKHRRADHLARSNHHFVKPLLQTEQPVFMMLTLGQTAQAIFNDDDRAIDNQPEIECAEAHQIA